MTAAPTLQDSDAARPNGGGPKLVPDWLVNLAAVGWRVIAVVAFAFALVYMASLVWTVTAAIALTIVVAAVFAPMVLRLRAQGRSRNAAAGIVWAVAILLIGGALLLVALAFLSSLSDLVANIQAGQDEIAAEVDSLDLPSWVTTLGQDLVDTAQEAGAGLRDSIASTVGEIGGILILATFLLFFFLRDGDKAWMWAFQSLGEGQFERITTAGDEALARVGGYLRGTTVLGLIIAATNYVFMVLLGVPGAAGLALLSFVAAYIPYFGGIIATVLILLATYGALGTGPAVVMLVLMTIRTFVVSSFMRPMVYRRTVSIHPALVLIVLPAGYQIAGAIGLFAAVPITAVIMATAQATISLVEPVPAPPLPNLVPAWLDRAAQWSWRALVGLAIAAGILVVFATIPLVVVPVVLAIIFAATLTPLTGWLMRRGHKRGRAAAMAVAGTAIAIIGVLILALTALVTNADELGATASDGVDSVNDASGGLLGLGQEAWDGGTVATVQTIAEVSEALVEVGTVVLLATLLTFYFIRDGAQLWARLMEHVRTPAAAELTASFSNGFAILGGYMTGTAAISFVGALSQFVIMVILDLPLALPVFVLSFFGGFIPYIGSALTTLLALFIAVSVGDTTDILIMLIWTLVFNIVQGNIVAPLVYNRTTNIHPAVVLAAIPAASAVAGILGMFLVIPVLGLLSATWRSVLHALDADDAPITEVDAPAPDPPEAADAKVAAAD